MGFYYVQSDDTDFVSNVVFLSFFLLSAIHWKIHDITFIHKKNPKKYNIWGNIASTYNYDQIREGGDGGWKVFYSGQGFATRISILIVETLMERINCLHIINTQI